MKRKFLMTTALLLSLNPACFAYYDVPLYATMHPPSRLVPESQPLDLTKRSREIYEDSYRQQQLNVINNQQFTDAARYNSQRVYGQSQGQGQASQPSRNPDRDYVQSKPLPLKGIYSYDAYGN